MSQFFQNVNPNLHKAALKIQSRIVDALKADIHSEKQILDFLQNNAFEISSNFLNDLAYEIQENGFLLLSLIALVLNRVMESDREDEENDNAATMWILSSIGELKYSKATQLAERALDWVRSEIEKQQE